MTKEIVCKFCKHERTVLTGAEILSFRRRNKLTLRELAELLKVSTSFVSDCEKDRRNFSSAMMQKLKMYELRHMVFTEEQRNGK